MKNSGCLPVKNSGCLPVKNRWQLPVKNKGYWLSFEAIISMALLGILLSMPLQESRPGLENLHIFKKESDLLLLWAKAPVKFEEMEKDFEMAFPNKSGAIYFDGKKIAIGKPTGKAISSKVIFFRQMKKHELRLVVFKNDFS